HKKLILTETDHYRRAEPRSDDLVRIARGHCHQSIGAAEKFYGLKHGFLERDVLRIFLNEVRDDFGVRFGLKFVPFLDQLVLQLEVILDDSVVDDDNLPGAIAVRMRILFGGTAMRRPAGMSKRVLALDRALD